MDTFPFWMLGTCDPREDQGLVLTQSPLPMFLVSEFQTSTQRSLSWVFSVRLLLVLYLYSGSFEIGSHCVALDGLELSDWLCLLSGEINSMHSLACVFWRKWGWVCSQFDIWQPQL